eukprot:TRINITY_DN1185_c0_g2_i1.p1 TRINITY_DN1185_c0_g2~~TRINITY_DN1185_c0_g2_i1.p1  ORF type:complete len:341 (+),score=58.40 TRINITY_DN1185_c0_g2_i1:74-1024(+)
MAAAFADRRTKSVLLPVILILAGAVAVPTAVSVMSVPSWGAEKVTLQLRPVATRRPAEEERARETERTNPETRAEDHSATAVPEAAVWRNPGSSARTPAPTVPGSCGADAARLLVVTAGEVPGASGVYRVRTRHRGALLYTSDSCRSRTCVLFLSGGGFWMLSPVDRAHLKGVGHLKTREKAAGRPPCHAGFGWEFLSSHRWARAARVVVDTPAGMDARGVDWRRLVAEHGGSVAETPAPSVPTPNQLRIDPADGKAYTFSDFVAYYHGAAEWERAQVAPASAAARLAAPKTVAPPLLAADQTLFRGGHRRPLPPY